VEKNIVLLTNEGEGTAAERFPRGLLASLSEFKPDGWRLPHWNDKPAIPARRNIPCENLSLSHRFFVISRSAQHNISMEHHRTITSPYDLAAGAWFDN
jgi:hypothetical protein